MTDFIYAARIGDFIKIGYSWHPHNRCSILSCEYDCEVALVGVIDGDRRKELDFHKENRQFAVLSEIYPKDAPCVVAFLAKCRPLPRKERAVLHGNAKKRAALAAGLLPVSRYREAAQ